MTQAKQEQIKKKIDLIEELMYSILEDTNDSYISASIVNKDYFMLFSRNEATDSTNLNIAKKRGKL